jgi:hypothetical protein
MKGPTLALIVLLFVAPVWSLAMWALLMMTFGALKDERFTLFRFFTGYFVQEPYNRKYRYVFAGCIGVFLSFAIIFNVLYVTGLIEP